MLIGEDRSGPTGIVKLWQLVAGEFFGFFGIDAKEAEQAGLAQDNEFAFGHDRGAATIDAACKRYGRNRSSAAKSFSN